MNSSFFKSSIIFLFIAIFFIIFTFYNIVYSENVFLEDTQIIANFDFSTLQFLWPTPNYKTITSHFGYRNRPTSGASSFHSGIDIGAPHRK